jgi:hypothetical protein
VQRSSFPARWACRRGATCCLPLAGLQPDTALALSLAKRTREVVLAVPGLLHIHTSERLWRRGRLSAAAGE